jgi:hypothetical protein
LPSSRKSTSWASRRCQRLPRPLSWGSSPIRGRGKGPRRKPREGCLRLPRAGGPKATGPSTVRPCLPNVRGGACPWLPSSRWSRPCEQGSRERARIWC